MRTLAHIVNPVLVDESSDLFVAQPITFESMRRAYEYRSGRLQVKLLSDHHAEDHPLVARDFLHTPNTQGWMQNHGRLQGSRQPPLLGDILGRVRDGHLTCAWLPACVIGWAEC